MVICDEIKPLALFLQFNGGPHHPEIISEVQRARRLYARQNSHCLQPNKGKPSLQILPINALTASRPRPDTVKSRSGISGVGINYLQCRALKQVGLEGKPVQKICRTLSQILMVSFT